MHMAQAQHATNLATFFQGETDCAFWPVLDEEGVPAVSMSIEAAEKLFAAIQFAKAFGRDDND